MKKTRISVVGIGYVGLCTAVGFANKGYQVVALTHNAEKESKINKGIPPFYEPKLHEALKNAVQKGNLNCLLNQPQKAILDSDITFNTVGTPSRTDGSIDLQHIQRSTREIGQALNKKSTYHLVVVKSTVVPGTTENMVKPILEKHSAKKCGPDFGLCMNPEFLREGSALEDTLNPDRVIIGEHDKRSGDTLEELYLDFYDDIQPPMLRTNLSTAEIIKYTNNAFLATKISFINTIAKICEGIPGADVTTVAKGIGLDHRINPQFLNAGLGYGGSCFPKDVKALISFSKQAGCETPLLETVEDVNGAQTRHTVEKARMELGELQGRNIAILGLAFKPNTDDMREARSVPIINQLLKEGANITVYDPIAIPTAKTIFQNQIRYASSTSQCLEKADCCILVTEWEEFRRLRPQDFIQHMKDPVLIDGRRIYNPEEFSPKLRFIAIGLGNTPASPPQ